MEFYVIVCRIHTAIQNKPNCVYQIERVHIFCLRTTIKWREKKIVCKHIQMPIHLSRDTADRCKLITRFSVYTHTHSILCVFFSFVFVFDNTIQTIQCTSACVNKLDFQFEYASTHDYSVRWPMRRYCFFISFVLCFFFFFFLSLMCMRIWIEKPNTTRNTNTYKEEHVWLAHTTHSAIDEIILM